MSKDELTLELGHETQRIYQEDLKLVVRKMLTVVL